MGLLDTLRGRQLDGYQDPQVRVALTAAGRKIDHADRAAAKELARRQEWQDEAWGYFDTIGEVKYGASYVGDALSRLRWFVAERDDPDAEPQPTDDPRAQAVLDRIIGPSGTFGEHAREIAINWTVTGECYLVGEPSEAGEDWSIRSVDELVTDAQGRTAIADRPDLSGSKIRTLDDDAFVGRLWRKHPRYSELAEAPLRGVLSSCEELLLLEKAVRATLRSRLPAGIFKVPDELSLGPADPTRDAGDGEEADDPFLSDLMEHFMTPVQNEGDASALVPFLLRGPSDALAAFEHMALTRPLDEKLDEMVVRALRRLAQGLELPAEIILGLADVNHWTGWVIERTTWKGHLEPKAQGIAVAATSAYLRPGWKAEGLDPDRFVLWYDPEPLLAPTPTAEDATRAHDRFAISDAALLARLGFAEDDAPDQDEVIKRVLIKAIVGAPGAGQALIPQIGGEAPPEAPEGEGAPGVPPDDQQPPELPAGPPEASLELLRQLTDRLDGLTASHNGNGDRLSALSGRLVDIDRHLADQLSGALDATMRRVLEKAGSRIHSKAKGQPDVSASIAQVHRTQIAAHLGPTVVHRLGLDDHQLVADGFDGFADRFDRWTAATQRQANRELASTVGLSDETLAELEAEQAEDRQQAWTWLKGALVTSALALLFQPQPKTPDVGEFDPDTTVDFSLVREAMARAGGAGRAVRTAVGRIGDAQIALRARGVATGVRILNTLQTFGVQERALVWDYRPGISRHTFEPHRALHDVQISGTDDPRLTVTGPFPALSFYTPGDHRGCRCSLRPVLAEQPAVT